MNMKKLLAVLLSVLLLFSCAACGNKEDESLYGNWKLHAMDYDGVTLLADELMEGDNYMELKKGGSVNFCLNSEPLNLRWKSEGESITLTAADGDMKGSVRNGIMTLDVSGTTLYYVQDGADASSLKAITLDEMFNGVIDDVLYDVTEPAPEDVVYPSEPEPNPIQEQWNGWWYGGIDIWQCTGDYEWLNGYTFDVVMFVDLDDSNIGTIELYEPYGQITADTKDHSFAYLQAHGDESYLYGDSGECFGDEIHANDWKFARNLSNPDRLEVGSSFTSDNGSVFGYTMTLNAWGSTWDGEDNYTRNLPHFQEYLDALAAGQIDPYGSYGEPEIEENPENGEPPAPTAFDGLATELLDFDNHGIFFVTYPSETWSYNSDYGKLKNESTGTGILFDPLLGSSNYDEWHDIFSEKYSSEDNYSMDEIEINGYRTLYCQYEDWLGAYVELVVDFDGFFGSNSYYGMRFSISGNSIDDCCADDVVAIVQSFELKK